jgi:hypothetical protein
MLKVWRGCCFVFFLFLKKGKGDWGDISCFFFSFERKAPLGKVWENK